MVRAKTCPRRLNIVLPAPLKRELDKLVLEDGRSLAEFTRSLISQALREKRLSSLVAK